MADLEPFIIIVMSNLNPSGNAIAALAMVGAGIKPAPVNFADRHRARHHLLP